MGNHVVCARYPFIVRIMLNEFGEKLVSLVGPEDEKLAGSTHPSLARRLLAPRASRPVLNRSVVDAWHRRPGHGVGRAPLWVALDTSD